jgi:hypothetical protein
MFSYRLDFSRRFQKSTPNMANLAFAKKANRDLKQTGRERDDDGYSHNDIPDLVQKK